MNLKISSACIMNKTQNLIDFPCPKYARLKSKWIVFSPTCFAHTKKNLHFFTKFFKAL